MSNFATLKQELNCILRFLVFKYKEKLFTHILDFDKAYLPFLGINKKLFDSKLYSSLGNNLWTAMVIQKNCVNQVLKLE